MNLVPASLGKEIRSQRILSSQEWGVDFRIAHAHEDEMLGKRMIRIILILGLFAPLYGSGCAHLKVQAKDQQAGHQITTTQPSAKQGLIYRLAHPADFFHFLARKEQFQQPKRAVALLTVGIIKTISNDGSYVIAELEPGIMVTVGSSVLITENGGETAHLKVAEITPPYFVAEIDHGHPEPGALLKQ